MRKRLSDSITVENLIEEKFSDVKNEFRLIAYCIREDYRMADRIKDDFLTVPELSIFLSIVKESGSCVPKDLLIREIRKSVRKKDLKIYLSYITRFFSVSKTEIAKNSIKAIYDSVKKSSHLRLAMSKVQEVISHVEDDSWDYDKIRKTLRPIYTINREREISVDLLDSFGQFLMDMESTEGKEDFDLIKTGIGPIDHVLGGIAKGEVAFIAGETGIGKSLIMEAIGLHACYKEKKNVFFSSLEMSVKMLQSRAYSNITNIPYLKFRMNELESADKKKWKQVIELYKKDRKKGSSIFEIARFPRGTTFQDIENYMLEVQDKKGIKFHLLVHDYLNLSSSPRSINMPLTDPKNQAAASNDLQNLATDFNGDGIAVLTAGQITDDGYGKDKLSKKHVKYARAIGENVNIIMVMTKTQANELLDNVITFGIIKSRSTKEVAPFDLQLNADCLKILQAMEREGSL